MNNLNTYKLYKQDNKINVPFDLFQNLYLLFLLILKIYNEIKPLWNNKNWFYILKSILSIASYLRDKSYDEELKHLLDTILKQDNNFVIDVKLSEED